MRRAKGLLKPLPSRFFSVSKGMPGRSVLLQKAHLCRGNFFISKSWKGSSRYLKRFWARFTISRAEQANRPFSIIAVWGPSKRAKPSAWDPPSRFVDQRLFWAISCLSSFQRTVFCREEQLLLRFSGDGSRRLKPNWVSLAIEGLEWAGRLFS